MNLEPAVAPLEGLSVEVADQGQPFDIAAWLLASMGASVSASGPSHSPRDVSVARIALAAESARDGCGALLTPSPVRLSDAGLPEGCLDYATGVTLAAGAIAGWLTGATIVVHETAVALEVRLPDVMATSYSAPNPMRPRPPRRAPGGGFYHADLGASGAADDFDRLLATLRPDVPAADIAAASQEWRLAVCDYRRASHRSGKGPHTPGSPGWCPIRFEGVVPQDPRDLNDRVEGRPWKGRAGALDTAVLDMTNMWAGPLGTRVLEQLGSRVTKVEPSFRPDGTRAMRGGGIYPGGEQVDPGHDSGMWNALNWTKRHVDIDLRIPSQRRRFADLAGTCDVVVESFSPRACANLGISEMVGDEAILVSIPAFRPGPQRDWVAYGSGVHAQSGLGDVTTSSAARTPVVTTDGCFSEPAVSYPDPLAGLTASLGIVAALAGRFLGTQVRRVEVSLDAAIQPLVDGTNSKRITRTDSTSTRPASSCTLIDNADDQGALLLELGRQAGLTVRRPVGGKFLDHPVGPLGARR